MFLNIIMRCTWIILFYLHFYFSSKLHITFWIDIFAGIIEIFRRSIWNLFQMEYLNLKEKNNVIDMNNSNLIKKVDNDDTDEHMINMNDEKIK